MSIRSNRKVFCTRATAAAAVWALVFILHPPHAPSAEPVHEHSLAAALESIQKHNSNEALEIAKRAEIRGEEPANKLSFTKALALLNKQPKTQRNTEVAAEIFKLIRRDAPGSGPGIASLYFLGRIAEVHRRPFDYEQALKYYTQLIEQFPGSFFGQLALHRRAMIQLYDPYLSETERQRLFFEIESLGELMSHRHVHSSFHFLMGRASQRIGLPPDVSLKHYHECAQLGVAAENFRGHVFVIVGVLAEELGRDDLAHEYFTRFLREYGRDSRVTMVRERLARIETSNREGGN